MKKLFVSMMACLLVASTSYAFESTITGSYNVRGQFYAFDDNTVANDQAYYDQDLDIHVQINTDENTKLNFSIEARDASQMDTRDVDAVIGGNTEFDVMSVWLTHKFGTGTTIEVGDMADPLFFGTGISTYVDDGIEGFTFKLTQDIAMGSVYFLTEKLDERNGSGIDNEVMDGDVDAYALGAVLNFNDIVVQPRIAYITDEHDINPAAGAVNPTYMGFGEFEEIMANLYVTATFGKLSLVADLVYESIEFVSAGTAVDYDVFGAYLEAKYDMDFMTVGGFLLYGSVDEEGNNEYGFVAYDNSILYYWHDDTGAALDFTGVTLFGLTASMPVNDQLTISGVAAYGFSNFDDNKTGGMGMPEYDGYELDLGASYKITDALTYTIEMAYASFDFDAVGTKDQDVVHMSHKLTLSF